MKLRISGLIAAFALAGILGSAQSLAQNAYIPNAGDNTVSVINTVTDKVVATIPIGAPPYGVAVSPVGGKVYITDLFANAVSVIDTITNTVTTAIPLDG